jgi:hypothetical protein
MFTDFKLLDDLQFKEKHKRISAENVKRSCLPTTDQGISTLTFRRLDRTLELRSLLHLYLSFFLPDSYLTDNDLAAGEDYPPFVRYRRNKQVLLHTELRLCRQNKVDISVHWINKV